MVAGGLIAVGLRLVRLYRKVAAPPALREPIEIINACEAHDVDKAEAAQCTFRRSAVPADGLFRTADHATVLRWLIGGRTT